MNNSELYTYDTELFSKLQASKYKPQGAVGDIPLSWAHEMNLTDTEEFDLPNKPLSREEVRTICQNEPLLKGYLCAMAWGAQGRGPSGSKSVHSAWNNRDKIEKKLKAIRDGNLSRSDMFNLFCAEGKVPGLGPAYFTKLLYFFHPAQPAQCYIMDQWTTKPVLILTGKNIIRHVNGSPTSQNSGSNYELFCRVVEDLAEKLCVESAEKMEERLFDVGSIKRNPRGDWRQIVYETWGKGIDLPRYNNKLIAQYL